MKNLDALQKYFYGGGDAESEKEIISDIYINKTGFIEDFLNFEKNNFRLLIGPKGCGKTILLHFINQSMLKGNMLSLIIGPEDYNTDIISGKKSNAEKVKEATSQLQNCIASKLSEGISFSLKNEDIVLKKVYDNVTGSKPPVVRIANAISSILPSDKARIASGLQELFYVNLNPLNIKQKINMQLEKLPYKLVVMIDNIDGAVEEDNGKFEYSNCWSIIESALKTAHELTNVAFIISIRTDIWHLINNVQNLGTSYSDKVNNTTKLKNDEDLLRTILLQRIGLATKILEKRTSKDNLLEFFYPEKVLLSFSSQEFRAWDQFIAKNSRNRARDMIHLIQTLIETAKKNKNVPDRISENDRSIILRDFAVSRIENIHKEYFQICPNLKEVIRHFHKTEYSFIEVVATLKESLSERVVIDKISMKQDTESALKLLKILHMASFINPKEYLDQEKRRYRHILFEDDEVTINPDSYNNLQPYFYEIHPVFHSYIKNH